MSNSQVKKISQLTLKTVLDGAEIIPAATNVSVSASTVGITIDNLAQYTANTSTVSVLIESQVSTAFLAVDYVTSASLVATYQPIGDYVTSASISAMIDAGTSEYLTSASIAALNYITATSADSAYQPAGDYVTSASIAAAYQAIGDYVTSSGLAALGYITATSADTAYQPAGDYVTSVSLAATYQPIGDYVTSSGLAALGYITATSADTAYQPAGDYVTSASIALYGYITATSADSAYQPAGDYLTSASVESRLAEYITSASLGTAAYESSETFLYGVQGTEIVVAASAVYTVTAADQDWVKISVGDNFTLSVAFVTSVVDGVIIEMAGAGSYTITHGVSVLFDGGAAPTYTSGGSDLIGVYQDGLNNVYIKQLMTNFQTSV